jgi:hypothetical protein
MPARHARVATRVYADRHGVPKARRKLRLPAFTALRAADIHDILRRRACAFIHLRRSDMKALLIVTSLIFGLSAAAIGHAQVPADAPAGTTGLCKDGSYSSAAARKGACRGHKGVKEWYAADTSAAAAADTAAPASAKKPSKSTNAAGPAAAAEATSAAAPAGATGLCKDGTYSSAESKKGACRGHQGVKEWYSAAAGAAPAAPARTSAPAAPAAPAAPPAAVPRTPVAPTAAAPMEAAPKAVPPMSTVPAAGGGAGKVWVNSETKVYHCQGDRYYGTTKQGEYMSEADAIAKGARAAHGKACSQ